MKYNKPEHICNHCDALLNDSNWYPSDRKQNTHICIPCYKKAHEKYKPKYDEKKRKKSNERRKLLRIKLKLETMLAYGNKCVSCGEDKILFLTLDHINNTGYLEESGGITFFPYLKRQGFPGRGTQLQVLCHNCNAIKEIAVRRDKIIRGTTKEVFIKQEYSISEELDNKLLAMATELYNKLKT